MVELGPLPEGCRAALDAVVELTGRTGAQSFEVGRQYLDLPYEQRSWWCSAFYAGARLTVDGQVSVAAAADGLAKRILDGGECQGCLKMCFVFNEDGYRVSTPEQVARVTREGMCRWRRNGDRWGRECGDRAPEGSTREKLAMAMAGCGVIQPDQIGAARQGRYDDFLSEFDSPGFLLVEELKPYGEATAELIQRVIAGEFDSTKEESDAWARSPEGTAAFAELISGEAAMRAQALRPEPPAGNRAERRGGKGKKRGRRK